MKGAGTERVPFFHRDASQQTGADMARLRVLMVTSEAFPLAKSGGLGDAVTGLARALSRAGMEVGILIPAYRGVLAKGTWVLHIECLSGMPGRGATLDGPF